MAASLILIQPRSTYLVAAIVSVIYVGTIILEVLEIVPITFPHTMINLTRVVTQILFASMPWRPYPTW